MNELLERSLGFLFADPWMLLIAACIPVAWAVKRIRGNPSIAVGQAAPFERLPVTWRVRAATAPAALHSLGVLLAIVALARPVVRERIPIETEGIDIVLAVDISSSMLSTDMDPKDRRTRLDAMKTAAKAFIEARANDRIAILTFAAFPELRCPPTLDHDAAISILDDVEAVVPRSQEDRTGIGLGLARAARIVRDSPARAKVVVLLTDGQENVFEITPADAAKLAKDFGVRVYTIGAGRGDRSFLGVQPMDFSELEKIAEATGGKFFRAEDKNALADTYASIDQLEKTALKDPRYRSEEMFHWVLAPGLAAIALAFLLRSLVFPEVP